MRIVDEQQKELAPRVGNNYSPLGLAEAMQTALKKAKQPVPTYLTLLIEEWEAQANGLETATFAMSCFWVGEGKLGNLKGVVETKPGYMQGQEVVEVKFNPAVISYQELAKQAKSQQCTSHVFTENTQQKTVAEQLFASEAVSTKANFQPDREPKYYLSRTPMRYVPMTALQAARVNAAIGKGERTYEWLSPSQINLIQFIEKHPHLPWINAIGAANLTEAWTKVQAVVTKGS